MKEIETYHRLCETKSGEISVDQHLVYLKKKGLTGRIASRLTGGAGAATATKSDGQIPLTTIRQAEAYPGGRGRSRPRVDLHYWQGGKESKKTIAFPDVDKGGDKEFNAFIEFLQRKDVDVKVVGGTLEKKSTQMFNAAPDKPGFRIRLRWGLPVLAVIFIGSAVPCFMYGQPVFGVLFILWSLFFLYKYFYSD